MDYTKIYDIDGARIGLIPGSRDILFVKTGQGGLIYGYEDRYLSLALEVSERFGYSVIVSETASDTVDTYNREMALIDEIFADAEYRLYYVGFSKGGLIGCWYGADNPRVERILSINAPLMVNFYNKTLPAIKRLGRARISLIYGSLDPSYKFVPFVDKYARVHIIEGAGHTLDSPDVDFNTAVIEWLINPI